MLKKLIVSMGPNAVGKSAAAQALLEMCPNCAYVDADWCRVINPFPFTEETKKAVTANIYCLLKNYLLCGDIHTIVFPYSLHGERERIFEEVRHRLAENQIEYELHMIILKCALDENIRRAGADGRDEERIRRGIQNTFDFYRDYPYPCIDTTDTTPEQAAKHIRKAAGIST